MSEPLVLRNLLVYSAQIAVVAAVAAAAFPLFRPGSPAARLAYWQWVLAGCLLLPAAQGWKAPESASAAGIEITAGQTLPAGKPPAPSLPRERAALGLLGAGALARLGWLALGFWRLRALRRGARPLSGLGWIESWQARLGVRAEVAVSDRVPGPITFGMRRPRIFLPPGFLQASPAVQEAICCHELIHVRRRDWLFTVAEETVRALLWFHPAVWWLLGQVQLAREQTVDRETVRLTQDRERYVEALLSAAGTGLEPDLAPAPLFLRKRHLARRVSSILKENPMSPRRVRIHLAGAFALVFLGGSVAVWAFPLQAPATINSGARLLHQPPVEYPAAARAKGIQGAVVLELSVDEKGTVTDARVLSGPEDLRRAALEAVLKWHYAPDISLPAKLQATIEFRLPPLPPAGESSPPRAERPAEPPAVARVPAPTRDLGVLKQIRIAGLSPEASEDLLRRLPAREGERITADMVGQVQAMVKEVDGHLMVYWSENSGETTLLIALPPEGGMLQQRSFAVPAAAPSADTQRIRVGGNVQRANLLHSVQPAFPPLAKAARITGVVRLNVTLGREGTVQQIEVVSGHPLLVPPAMEAVRQWVYRPTLLNGQPVEVVTQVEVNFTLREEQP